MVVRQLELSPHQLEFVLDETAPIIALSGGYRTGKTVAAVAKCCRLGAVNWPAIGLVVEPTYRMILDVFLPTAEKLLTAWGVPYEWLKGDSTLIIGAGSSTPIHVLCRSGDAAHRLKGITAGWALIDEFEVQEEEVAKEVLARISDPCATVQQLGLVGTPEGEEGWGYTWLEDKPSPGTRTIRARTRDNPWLGKDYEARMRSRLTDAEAVMFLDGIRTKRSGRVYPRFDRARHVRPCPDIRGELEMFCDFNVGKMVWLFVTLRGGVAHVWGELVREDIDTMAMADEAAARLAEIYGQAYGTRMEPIEAARMTTVICDAAGSAASTSSKLSDVMILKTRGFRVRHPAANPFVEDRVSALNVAFHEGRVQVAPECKALIRALEMQGYAKDGRPEKHKDPKKGHDHANDALGYGVWLRWPYARMRGNQTPPSRGTRHADGSWG